MWLRRRRRRRGVLASPGRAARNSPAAVKQLGLSASLRHNRPLLPVPAVRTSGAQNRPLRAFESSRNSACGPSALSPDGRARGEVRLLALRSAGLPYWEVNRRKIAAEAVKLHLDPNDELPLFMAGLMRGVVGILIAATADPCGSRCGGGVAAGLASSHCRRRRRGGLRLLRQRSIRAAPRDGPARRVSICWRARTSRSACRAACCVRA